MRVGVRAACWLLFAGCTREPTVLRVGEFASMTGAWSAYGEATHNGVVLAIEEINQAGGVRGVPLELIHYDDRSKAQEAGTAVKRLIADDQVIALLGEAASNLSTAGGRVAQQHRIPMISPASTNAKVTEIGDMVFRVCFVDSFQGYVGARFASDNLKAKKAAVLYDQAAAYSNGLKNDFAAAFVALGGQVATEQTYVEGSADFAEQLTAIREAGADVLYVPGYYADAARIAVQARQMGLTVPLLGGDGWGTKQLWELAGPAIDGAYYTHHFAPEEQRPEVQAFVTAHKARFGHVPDGLAALGYDAAKVLADALGRARSRSGEDLAAAIAATEAFPGVTGPITIDDARNARKPAVVVQIRAGVPTFVTSILPPGEP